MLLNISILSSKSREMNIFYLSHIPEEAAQMHCDKHVVKMIVEYCQLLSTAHRILDGLPKEVSIEYGMKRRKVTRWYLSDIREDILYKASHISHPSSLWVRRSQANYQWLYSLLYCLIQEYKWRYERTTHACEKLLPYLSYIPTNLAQGLFSQPTPAMPSTYIVERDSITSYRNYYVGAKSAFATWKKRDKPSWWLSR